MKHLKKKLKNFLHFRLIVMTVAFLLMFSIVLARVFTLQVLNGASYQEDFSEQIHKTIAINSTRGNIYDCNGELLAYNKLSYNLTITDNGSYESMTVKNEQLNAELAEIITTLEGNGEKISNSFGISRSSDGKLSYNVKGTAKNRFLADVFGSQTYAGLSYNKTYGFQEAEATPENVMTYLMGDDKYQVSDAYDDKMKYEIVVLRYAISANLYARYRTTLLAENIGEETIAYMKEHSDRLTGVDVEEATTRVYNRSVYFASIIGYTGRISAEEYETLSYKDPTYSINDIVGKSGLEQYYESYLKGYKGEKEVYINNVGKITEVIGVRDSVPGNNLYISIDSELQEAVYKLLEQEIAGIVYSNIQNKTIPMEDVYFALIDNNVIDVSHFSSSSASGNEKQVQKVFTSALEKALASVSTQLSAGPQTLNAMSDLTVDYFTYIISMLKSENLLVTSRIDTSDATYKSWRDGKLSPKDYLNYCITKQWIDSSLLDIDEKYSTSDEIYQVLCDFITEELQDDNGFAKLVYQSIISEGTIPARQLCMILYDQGALKYDEETYAALSTGTITASAFLLDKIDRLEITPAQLALDPCTGSAVMSDPNTGEIKALVSYPGYDGNKLANTVDADYFASLLSDKSNPQWNYATQEETAPGSTFKMVIATAGLAENVIATDTLIDCKGVFEEVDNKPQCWIYQKKKTHGLDNVSDAIKDSCNIFFYTVGYELSKLDTGVYNDAAGISYIRKYASLYGLDRKTGIEIAESTPEVADEYPVMAAIGQSNNNFTTISLSRYITAVASECVYEYQLMNKITDSYGNIIEIYRPDYQDISGILEQSEWDAIHDGLRRVVLDQKAFKGTNLPAAGKTGTAQQTETRPNHALFVGYCPYDNPEITIAVRIAFGNTSHNATLAAANILSYYFGNQSLDSLLSLKASGVNGSSVNSIND